MDFYQFNLDSRLNYGIKQAGYRQPTPIQTSAIPLAMAGHDLIGTAQTGTGKTAAFILPILHKILNNPGKKPQALIVTPTRELAEQIHQTVIELKGQTKISSIAIYGGVKPKPQIEALRRGVDIVVACPGRLLDHLQNKHIRLGNVSSLVLDEADRMLDMGFFPDIKRILQYLPTEKQTMLFSATFPKEIETLARQTLRKPERVSIGITRPAHTVSHTLYPVPQHLKRELLIKILKQTDTNSVLIFTRTKRRAQRLSRQIANVGYRVTSLHGDRTQGQRQNALAGFKKGKFQIMVATDIAARGLDIESISHVINFDMPNTADAYIHRIGRTGRAKREGEAFTLCTPEDSAMVKKIERIMKQRLSRKTLPGFDYEVPTPNYQNSNEGQKRSSTHSSQRSRNRHPVS